MGGLNYVVFPFKNSSIHHSLTEFILHYTIWEKSSVPLILMPKLGSQDGGSSYPVGCEKVCAPETQRSEPDRR